MYRIIKLLIVGLLLLLVTGCVGLSVDNTNTKGIIKPRGIMKTSNDEVHHTNEDAK